MDMHRDMDTFNRDMDTFSSMAMNSLAIRSTAVRALAYTGVVRAALA